MSRDTSRSEQVVEQYKRHKLAASTRRKIHRMIIGFEQERADDVRYARIGLIILMVLIGIMLAFYWSNEQITLP